MKKYDISTRNKVKRIPSRGHYDHETVHQILDAGFVCHVGFSIDNQPFVIPTLYGREGNKVYLHGASTSRMLKNLEQGIAVCITVTHIDGLVLARSAFHHSMNYRSVMIFGVATKIASQQKEHALAVISDQIIQDRWQEVRKPTFKELKATTVLEITIDQASAKIRQGPPGDDKEDYALDVWAGVVPMQINKEKPKADPLLNPGVEMNISVKKFLKN